MSKVENEGKALSIENLLSCRKRKELEKEFNLKKTNVFWKKI
jgi:hypothetical protein